MGAHMKFIKTVSFFCIMTVAMSSVLYGVPMTPQIRNLLEEKEEKIKALEQCDGKRKGWMIAGISTIGLTAVGVGVNIAQSSKSNKLSDQIDNANQELQRHETHLTQIQSQISEKEREKAEAEKAAREGTKKQGAAEDKTGNQSDDSEDAEYDERIGCFYSINGSGQPERDCQNPGDWSVTFRGATVKGVAACSELKGKSRYAEATDQLMVESAYTPTATEKPKGPYCYCKETYPDVSSWVFHGSTTRPNGDLFKRVCAADCAYRCFHDRNMFDE